MLRFFKKKEAAAVTPPSPAGYFIPEAGAVMLGTPRRKKLVENIWQRTSLSRKQFDQLYMSPITRYAELVQLLPASENHHHAYAGGMLDHGLEIVAYALKMRQSIMLPLGAPPETQAEQAEAWSAAVSYAALLHDIGKIAVDVHVELKGGKSWHPWSGPISAPYRVRYRKGRDYKLHNAAAGLMYTAILGSEAMSWLSQYEELWASLIYVLAGQYEHAGVLGELVVRADQASVAYELGSDPNRAMTAPKQSIQRKLVDGLRYLLKEEMKINQAEASDGWLTEEGLWLVSKTVCDRLRAYLLSQGVEGIPEKNTALFNLLQDNAIAQVNGEGKAIWKATVLSQTGWKNTFTFLRLASGLIWSAKERPSMFLGTVTVEHTTPLPAPPTTHSLMSASDSMVPAPRALSTPPTRPAPAAFPTAPIDEHVSDLLNLFDRGPKGPLKNDPLPVEISSEQTVPELAY